MSSLPSPRARAALPAPRVERHPLRVNDIGRPVDALTLSNAHGILVRLMAIGGTIMSLEVPDHRGVKDDVALGFDSPGDYLSDGRYFGSIVGRYANRIAGARFSLDGEEYRLAANNGENSLHGGIHGFHQVVWDLQPFSEANAAGVELLYTSLAGEEGYPGTLETRVTYTLTNEDELIVDYQAVTDQATPVNLTQHTYFNLAGHDAGDILDHELTIHASRFTPVGPNLIPTGELRPVRGTPFDFTSPRRIGERIGADDEQLRLGSGYDHNYVIDRDRDDTLVSAARLRDPLSGRTVELLTTECGMQLYSGNHLAGGRQGKGGHAYRAHSGVALETQHFPDSPNQAAFPSTILRPGQVYQSRTVYRFSVS